MTREEIIEKIFKLISEQLRQPGKSIRVELNGRIYWRKYNEIWSQSSWAGDMLLFGRSDDIEKAIKDSIIHEMKYKTNYELLRIVFELI